MNKSIKLKPKIQGDRDNGREIVENSSREMYGLIKLKELYSISQPLKGQRITVCVAITPETANFILFLKLMGAEVQSCSDGLRSCNDDVVAYLTYCGIKVFAQSIETQEEHNSFLQSALEFHSSDGKILGPTLIIDDGADISTYAINHSIDLLSETCGISEQTNSGIRELYKYQDQGKLPIPVINVSDSISKSKFDNLYGTRESLIGSLNSIMNIQISGKHVIVFGYGNVGRGVAAAIRSLGAHVYIAEADPINLALAHMDGYHLTTVDKGIEFADIFITATGNINVIDEHHLKNIKDGAILCNIGHKNVEINVASLSENSSIREEIINKNLTKYTFTDGKRLFLLCSGYLINLAAGTGNPPLAMSITFTNHFLAIYELINNREKYLKNEVYPFRKELDEKSIILNIEEVEKNITYLTEEQSDYIGIKNTKYIRRHKHYYSY